MIKDTQQGMTHHENDECYKCKNCGAHCESKKEAENCKVVIKKK